MSPVARKAAVVAAALVVLLTAAACRSGGSAGPTATPTTGVVATPSPDAAAMATTAAGSPAAKLAAVVLDPTDYPAEFGVKRQQARLVAPSDVPGLASSASGFFATSATSNGSEFVNLVAVVVDAEADAAAALAAFAPDVYLPGLTGGAANATSKPESATNAPAAAKAFSYAGTVTSNEGGELRQHEIAGVAVAFARGRTFVVIVGAAYDAVPRTADVMRIATLIDARLAAATP